MTFRTNQRSAALGAGILLLAGSLVACRPAGRLPQEEPRVRPPESQDVDAEWEVATKGSVELCDSPRAFIPFDKPVESQVYDVISAYDTGLDETMERLTAKVVVEESEKYGLDPWLVVGVMRVESRFYNFAESNRNARGLMQLRPFVAQDLANDLGIRWTGPDTLFNPVKNVKIGVAYLAILNHRFHGNLDRTLAAYNMGPARVRSWLKAGRELPTGYASLVTDYKSLLGDIGKDHVAGDDLRGPITAIEHKMARKAATVVLPVVADVDPADDGIATEAAIPGLLANPEPAFEPKLKDKDAPAAKPADEESTPKIEPAIDTKPGATLEQALAADAKTASPEPAIPSASDSELDQILAK